MKKLILLISIAFIVGSCGPDPENLISSTELNENNEQPSVVDGRIVFKDYSVYLKAFETLLNAEAQQKWSSKYKIKNLQSVISHSTAIENIEMPDVTLSNLPPPLWFILNENAEVQIGNVIRVYKNNSIYSYHVEDYKNGKEPYAVDKGIVQPVTLESQANARTTFAMVFIFNGNSDILSSKYQKQFTYQGHKFKWVQELYFYSEVSNQGSQFPLRYAGLFVVLKLEVKLINWTAFNAPFHLSYDLHGDANFSDGILSKQINSVSNNLPSQQGSYWVPLFSLILDPDLPALGIDLGLSGSIQQSMDANPAATVWNNTSFIY